MDIALTILAVAATVLVVAAVADRLDFSAPLLLIVVGIGASFIPGLTPPELTPELVLLGLLPPLLYATAIRTSVIDFRANKRAIISLSVVLVVVTALGVGLITWWLLPVDFAVAFALGAVVAPPDAVAATVDRPPGRAAPAAGHHPGGRVAGQRRHRDHLPAGGHRRHRRRRLGGRGDRRLPDRRQSAGCWSGCSWPWS